ncbi:flagellin [Oligoflexaceae bacterium]|nr:flagellin [Oligoflexaceae bacterium]
MGLRIRTNIAAINAQRRLRISTGDLQSSMAKLASGKRINKAADDAAGLAVSENLRGDVRSLNQAKRNAQDGVSLVQTAEGGLTETSNMLTRLRELAVQAASDTIGPEERGFLDKEYVQLKEEIDRITNSTEFNGTKLLVGDNYQHDELQNPEDTYPLEIQVAHNYLPDADALDSDHPVNVIRIDLSNINAYTEGDGSLELGRADEGTRVSDKRSAQTSINTIDKAISRVNDYRSYLGAIQNRLEITTRNIGVQSENIEEARSRIVDTDFAEETANMAQQSILQQAGISVQAQANSQPQVALSLLG